MRLTSRAERASSFSPSSFFSASDSSESEVDVVDDESSAIFFFSCSFADSDVSEPSFPSAAVLLLFLEADAEVSSLTYSLSSSPVVVLDLFSSYAGVAAVSSGGVAFFLPKKPRVGVLEKMFEVVVPYYLYPYYYRW